jgi:YD repeat-containing protein
MNQNYRSGTNPTLPVTVGGDGGSGTVLFNGYPGVDTRIDTLSVVIQLVLPDGRALTFKYNEFGEVAEVQMPTNGKVQYDYGAVLATGSTGLPSGNSLAPEVEAVGSVTNGNVHAVDRAVTARRTYADGSTLEGTWSYSYKSDKTELKCISGSNTLVDEWHYFLPAQRFLIGTGATGPDGTGYSKWSTGVERRSEMVDTNGTTVLSASEQDWSQRKTIQSEGKWTTGYAVEEIANDNRVTETRKYLDDGSYSRVDTLYDQSLGDNNHINNPVQVDEYDLDHTTLKRETKTTYNTTGNFAGTGVNNLNILTLPAEQDVYDAGDLVNPKSQTTYEYDNYTADANNVPLQTYSDYSSIPGRTHPPETVFDTTYTQRGNATRVTRMIDSSTSISSYTRYDVLGNVVSIKDPKTNVSTISYLDDFGDGGNPGLNTGGHSTYALPTRLTSPAPNAGESPQTAYTQYDFSAGLLTGFKDRNGTITQTFYNDAFDRPTQIKAALGTNLENHTAMYYAPQTNPFSITLTNNDVLSAKDQASIDDRTLRSWTHTDGFGRTFESWTSDPQGDVKVVTGYDGLGRAVQTSNPFRPATETQYNTTTAYDLAGRVKTVTTADNAVVTTAYNGARVLVIDQAGKQRISQTDGLGRLTDVWEVTPADSATEPVTFPGYSGITAGYRTTYSYDALDDLLTAKQRIGTSGTLQTRTFVYDGLKRLKQAINPESGTINYTYDANSNLATKLDARLIRTTYTYDALNRVTSRTYMGDPQSTPAVFYKYDGQSLTGAPSFTRGSSIGRLVAVTYGTGSAGSYQGYDQLGRVNVSYQQTDSQNYGFSYGYNLASEVQGITRQRREGSCLSTQSLLRACIW